MSKTEAPDPCATCALADVLDGPDPAAHWLSPFSSHIVAWTCSAPCASKLEFKRSFGGSLTV